jgi:ATP-dependent 26S proteasome regulatory subunit
MKSEDPGNVQYNTIGGLTDQIRELREVLFQQKKKVP